MKSYKDDRLNEHNFQHSVKQQKYQKHPLDGFTFKIKICQYEKLTFLT